MSDPVILALISTIGSIVTAILTAVVTVMMRDTRKAVREVEKQTNSMKDALVKVTGESEHAKGVLEGKGQER